MAIMHKTLFCAISFLMCPACGDSDGNTTAVITTIITGNPSATEADETTGPEGPTSTTEATTETSTTDVEPATTTLESTTSTTGEPWGCFNEGTECPPPPKAASFCEYVAESCATHGIEPFYCDIVNGMCDESRMVDECQVCFGLANYCSQIGSDCDGLMTECLCAHAALEGGE